MNKSQLEQRLIFRIPVLSHISNSSLSNIYKPKFGLSVSEWHIMSIIGRFAPISPKKISETNTMNAFHVSRNIAKLEKKNWVERQFSQLDKRKNTLTLTEAGQDIYEQIEHIAQCLEKTLLEVLTFAERKNLGEILDKLEPHYREVMTSQSWADHLNPKLKDSNPKE